MYTQTHPAVSSRERRRSYLTPLLLALALPLPAAAQIVAFDMVGSASQNLTSFTNPFDGAFGSPGDGFQKYQRFVSPSIPFAVLDDSLSIFPPDSLGIVKEGNTDVFFGVVDTENGDNSGPVAATWTFDVSGATDLVLAIDMGAMGDFESSDFFEWTYSIDGGPTATAFASTVDESGSFTYTLEGGSSFTLNDPMLVQGTILSDDLATFSVPIAGTGSSLTLTLTAQFNGGSEAVAFQNIVLSEGGVTLDVVAFDMVASADQNLNSFTNPFAGAFGSPGDGFEKYRRFVSPSIPFAVLDDSLSIFPPDSLGIVKEGNTDVFFGVVDTENPDNSGPVAATWKFDVSGATDLGISIDMGAMGDFESSDFFEWTYSLDGGPTMVAFASTVDEAGSFTYTLEGGSSFTLNDPMLVQGTILSDDLATFVAPITGTGAELTVTLTAQFNGGSEAVAFQNLIIAEGLVPPPPPELEIWEIQGAGLVSPVEGDVVTTRGNVVTCLATNGFFMQTPASRTDGDVATSDGIFVFTGGSPGVAVGDLVDVTGEVDEFFGLTELAGGSTITVTGTGTVPAAIVFDAFTPSPDPTAPSCGVLEFECFESMLVDVPFGTVAAANQEFGSDPFAEVHVVTRAGRAFREPGVEFPGLAMPPIPTWDGNPEVFELDPDKLGLPNQAITAGTTFSARGVIGFEFNHYELWPNELTILDPAPLPVPVRAEAPNELTVGSLNLFRLFDDVDDPPSVNSVGETRDDAVVSTAEYLRRRAKLAAYVVEVMRSPDVLAVQEAEKLGVLQDLAGDVGALDPSVAYTAYLVEGNDVGTIDVGFLVRSNVQVSAVTQLGAGEVFTFDDPDSALHDRPPLLLEGVADGTFPFAVMALHMRSLGGIETERVQRKRFEQAASVAEKIQAIQTADPDVYLVVAGDFNAFEFTDGYADVTGIMKGDFDPAQSFVCSLVPCVDLVSPDLTDQVLNVAAAERYSFIFRDTFNPAGSRGDAQVLDHALTTRALDPLVTGYQYGRGNADAPEEYLEDDGSVDPAILPLRSSDHDGLVLYVLEDEDQDGVPDADDVCLGTAIPEGVPTEGLGVNRFALVDGDGVFDTTPPSGTGPGAAFTIEDTAGCSCEQIILAQGLGNGHTKHGCSLGAMQNWVALVSP